MTNLEMYSFIKAKNGGGHSPIDIQYQNFLAFIEIPDGTTVLPSNIFSNFSLLYGVKLNNDNELIEIGDYAFYNCPLLENIEVPESVQTIGEKSFGWTDDGIVANFMLYGTYGSIAETYAIENGIPFFDNARTFTYGVFEDGQTAWLRTYSGTATIVTTPIYYAGYRIIKMNADSFKNKNVKILKVSHGVWGIIDGYASALPRVLEKLYLPNTLTVMESGLCQSCTNLTTIVLEQQFNCAIDCAGAVLTHECMVDMITMLKDLTNDEPKKLTLGSANLAKLSNEEIVIATEKNWTLA